VLIQQRLGNTEGPDLDRVVIGDHPPDKDVGAAGDLRKTPTQQASGARLCHSQPDAGGASPLQNQGSQISITIAIDRISRPTPDQLHRGAEFPVGFIRLKVPGGETEIHSFVTRQVGQSDGGDLFLHVSEAFGQGGLGYSTGPEQPGTNDGSGGSTLEAWHNLVLKQLSHFLRNTGQHDRETGRAFEP
jgi:hypothetical protein